MNRTPSYHGLRYAHDLGDLNPVAFALRMRLVPLRNLGAAISPDNCWAFLQGIETLSLRMERHCDNATGGRTLSQQQPQGRLGPLSRPCRTHPAMKSPKSICKNGFGGMIAFGIKGGLAAGKKFIDSLQLISHLANVGDAKSLAIHPASTTHSQLSAGAAPGRRQSKRG